MNLQKLLLKNHKIAKLVLENLKPNIFYSLGFRRALKNFKYAINTPAYKKLLEKSSIDSNKIISEKQYKNLPIIDKSSYLLVNDLKNVVKKPLFENYTIETSGGYSGKSLYWPRYSGQDDTFPNYMKLGLIKIFNVDKRTTLFINTFALGSWVTGVKLARNICTLANNKNIKMTAINVGTNLNDAVNAIMTFHKYYDQIILAGYPPFIKNIIEVIVNDYNFERKKLFHILAGGEAFVEEWREDISKMLNINVEEFESMIVSAFGSSDTGLEIGYETPLTIKLRRTIWKDKKLQRKVLKKSVNFVPHFFQYNPLNVWIEEHEGELLFTADSGIPIIRYNLHDSGGIMDYQKALTILKNTTELDKFINTFKPFHLPLVYVYGRSDGSVSVDGENIYVQDIQTIINSPQEVYEILNSQYDTIEEVLKIIPFERLARKILSIPPIKLPRTQIYNQINNFKIFVGANALSISLELKEGCFLSKEDIKELEDGYYKAFVIMLYKCSFGYANIVNENLKSSDLVIKVNNYKSNEFSIVENSVKRKYIVNNIDKK